MKITKRALSVSLLLLIAAACFVTDFTGPAVVNVGQTGVTYDIPFETSSSGANGTAYVFVDVPTGWTLTNATYNATVNGSATSGNATTGVAQSGTPCVAVAGPAAGYQRLGFSATFPTVTANDSGTLHLTFTANGSPGTFTLRAFGGGSFGGPTQECNDDQTETLEVNVFGEIAPQPPIVQKFFSPSSIAPGATSRLTVRVRHNNAQTMTGVNFSDTYPAGLVNAATPNLANTCGGTASSTANSLSLTGGTIAGNSPCEVSIDVTAAAEGNYVNDVFVTGAVGGNPRSSTGGGTLTVSAAAASATVPTMSEWALIWMVALLALVAVKMMR